MRTKSMNFIEEDNLHFWNFSKRLTGIEWAMQNIMETKMTPWLKYFTKNNFCLETFNVLGSNLSPEVTTACIY